MIENKWVNGGIAVAFACVLAGLAVWVSSGQPAEQPPRSVQPAQVDDDDPDAPPDMGGLKPPTNGQVQNETEAAPPDMGSLGPPTKG